MPERILLLVDGTAVAYRAFHAIANLSTRDGRPTNAVYGFIRMLRQLHQSWKASHWAVVFDGGLPQDRMDRLATYKAQRPAMPDALRQQLELINEYLRLAEVASVRLEAQEADDVIASIAAQACPPFDEVLIAATDKDLYQLVTERVRIVPPTKAGERIGPQQVLEKTGVPPERIVEWLALTGDAVDNIPGVPGVGPKTAAKLLADFGGLEGIWTRLDRVTPEKLREALRSHRADIERNVALMRLRRDLPLPLSWEALEARGPDPAKLLPFFERMEFYSLARELREASAGTLFDAGA